MAIAGHNEIIGPNQGDQTRIEEEKEEAEDARPLPLVIEKQASMTGAQEQFN